MNYVKIVSLSALSTLCAHTVTTQAADLWTSYPSRNGTTQAEPLYYNQPHIPLTPVAPQLLRTAPTALAPAPAITSTRPLVAPNKIKPTAKLAHLNKMAATAALVSVLKNRHLKGSLDAETFQAIMGNPILTHARTSAANAARTRSKPSAQKPIRQQSLHNTPARHILSIV